ncbi:hypothetical protein MJG53_011874 [Ovis ammon polii x Ovis aries]|uniref:Uncharacterized protein n=1 Tax=Ovis ammon polii x Ovis aries TaxID=2918886 RepID=A0ACB9UPL8_9CETA|nr:hypothetical protein MJG53_011874 [Ovis ammon polii x Ovis aries]
MVRAEGEQGPVTWLDIQIWMISNIPRGLPLGCQLESFAVDPPPRQLSCSPGRCLDKCAKASLPGKMRPRQEDLACFQRNHTSSVLNPEFLSQEFHITCLSAGPDWINSVVKFDLLGTGTGSEDAHITKSTSRRCEGICSSFCPSEKTLATVLQNDTNVEQYSVYLEIGKGFHAMKKDFKA